MARICKAVGVTKLDNTEQLHNLPMIATIALDKDDPTRNVIKGYKAKAGGNGTGSLATTNPTQGGTASAATTESTQQKVSAAATAPTAAVATGAAPWAR